LQRVENMRRTIKTFLIVCIFSFSLNLLANTGGDYTHNQSFGREINFFEDIEWHVESSENTRVSLLDDINYALFTSDASFVALANISIVWGSGEFLYSQYNFKPGRFYYVVIQGNQTGSILEVFLKFSTTSWLVLFLIVGGCVSIVVIVLVITIKKRKN